MNQCLLFFHSCRMLPSGDNCTFSCFYLRCNFIHSLVRVLSHFDTNQSPGWHQSSEQRPHGDIYNRRQEQCLGVVALHITPQQYHWAKCTQLNFLDKNLKGTSPMVTQFLTLFSSLLHFHSNNKGKFFNKGKFQKFQEGVLFFPVKKNIINLHHLS